MKINDLKIYENKKVRIFLRNNFYYSGCIIKFLEDDTLKFRDKFNKIVLISAGEITTITELNGDTK